MSWVKAIVGKEKYNIVNINFSSNLCNLALVWHLICSLNIPNFLNNSLSLFSTFFPKNLTPLKFYFGYYSKPPRKNCFMSENIFFAISTFRKPPSFDIP